MKNVLNTRDDFSIVPLEELDLGAHLVIFQWNHCAIKTEPATVEVAFKLFG